MRLMTIEMAASFFTIMAGIAMASAGYVYLCLLGRGKNLFSQVRLITELTAYVVLMILYIMGYVENTIFYIF